MHTNLVDFFGLILTNAITKNLIFVAELLIKYTLARMYAN